MKRLIPHYQTTLFRALIDVQDKIILGMPRRAAINSTAWENGIDEPALYLAWNIRGREKRLQRAIVDHWLTEAGLTRERIAAILDIHPQTLTKQRQKQKRKNGRQGGAAPFLPVKG